MSWLRSSFPTNFRYDRTYIFNYLCRSIILNQRQQFSCLTKTHKNQVLGFKCKRIKERDFSVLEAIGRVRPVLNTFFQDFSNNWKAYVPIFGALWYRQYGFHWYKTLDEIDVLEFMRLFKMEDTYFSRFNIVELHVWMLLFNLPKGGRVNFLVKNGLIQAMWRDCERRGRIIDKKNPTFSKDVTKLNNKFKVSLILYDYGYLKDDAMLSSILWYNFFDRKDTDPRILEDLVQYIRTQMQHISMLNFKELNHEEYKTGIWKSPNTVL